jgi:hypothetical protein
MRSRGVPDAESMAPFSGSPPKGSNPSAADVVSIALHRGDRRARCIDRNARVIIGISRDRSQCAVWKGNQRNLASGITGLGPPMAAWSCILAVSEDLPDYDQRKVN